MRSPVPRDDPGNAIASELRARQRPDGGWSARPGGPADAESTAWAVMALGSSADPGAGGREGVVSSADAQAAVRGRRWLLRSQRTDGGWAWSAGGPESGWPTGPAVLALAAHPESEDAAAGGGRWLLRNRAWTYPLKARFLLWLFRRRPPVELDFSLHGWPWVPGTFGWVEPTSWALLALRATESVLPAGPFRERSEDGEAMLLDRACVGGGWNYGNRTVLGEDLWPYPDTTAIALLALTRRARDPGVREGLDALEKMLSEPASRLSLALAVLALEAHGRETADLLERLRTHWGATSDPATTRAAALAVLALRGAPIPGTGMGGSA